MPVIMRMLEALTVADDGPLTAKRAESREQPQRDLGHPGSAFSVSGSAIKRTMEGVKATADRPAKSNRAAGRHPPGKSESNEKRILLFVRQRGTLLNLQIGRYIS
jgi:hypothetical protein